MKFDNAYLAGLCEHIRHHLVEVGHQLEHGVVGQVLQGELTLAGVTRVCLAQHCVAVPRHHLYHRGSGDTSQQGK